MLHRFIGDGAGERDRYGHLLPGSFAAAPVPAESEPAAEDEPRDVPTLDEWTAAGYLPEAWDRAFSSSAGAGIDSL